MTARRKARVTVERLRHSARLTGSVRTLAPTLRAADVPWMWDARRGGFLLPLAALDDALAALEAGGHVVSELLPGGVA